MNHKCLLFLFFTLLHCVTSYYFHLSCPNTYLDRYCALRNRNSLKECAQKHFSTRSFDILQNCYKSMSERGKDLTIEQMFDEICDLDLYEINGISGCGEYALFLDKKKNGTIAEFVNVSNITYYY
ncbi:uncharacterized protein LOC111638012 [Centruroides sculpturatus]|uniref:uncharacterized protein LOC111638012 n=1 Tax=Centruroides sculpturatus TaxID=218467 RepID=UPI000C6D39F5|nr:uncharacterized protein LOC111638012 [Centruroides sculpturatus]